MRAEKGSDMRTQYRYNCTWNGYEVLSLSKVLFGQSRRSILALLYGHADEQFYLREIARRAGTGIGATQRELGQLTDAGLLHRLRRGNQVYYRRIVRIRFSKN